MVRFLQEINILTLVLSVCLLLSHPFSVRAGIDDEKDLAEKNFKREKATGEPPKSPKKRVISRGYVPAHTTVLPKQYGGLPRDAVPVDGSDRIFTYKQ